MYKPKNLRDFLAGAIPELSRDPDRLSVYIPQGTLVSTMAPGLSWEYRYQLDVIITDFAGDPDVVMAPLIDWMRTNQPDSMANPDLAERAIAFEVDLTSAASCDIAISLQLTERAICTQNPDGSHTVTHPPEPQDESRAESVHWQLYVERAGSDAPELVAEWDQPA